MCINKTKIESTALKSIGKMSHALTIDGEVIASSSNLELLTDIRGWFDNGLTIEDLKGGGLDRAELHRLMKRLLLSGNSKLAASYFEALEKKEKLEGDYIETLNKSHSKFIFERKRATSAVADELFNKTGWRFKAIEEQD